MYACICRVCQKIEKNEFLLTCSCWRRGRWPCCRIDRAVFCGEILRACELVILAVVGDARCILAPAFRRITFVDGIACLICDEEERNNCAISLLIGSTRCVLCGAPAAYASTHWLGSRGGGSRRTASIRGWNQTWRRPALCCTRCYRTQEDAQHQGQGPHHRGGLFVWARSVWPPKSVCKDSGRGTLLPWFDHLSTLQPFLSWLATY